MRRRMMMALAAIVFAAISLPGCFYVGPYGWRHPEHDGGRRYHREWRERHGALTTPADEQGRRNDHDRRGQDNDSVG